ncbi:GNAT family N-acetyltransferase [Micromonospora sp. NPDC050417]|uniref:GNAT family N-acetyltransferase n=1 Tax=Micromonospora sp. NPDC050417 TaxID=3364280 RepID=UPI00378CEF7D
MTNPSATDSSADPIVELDLRRHRYTIAVAGQVAGFTQFFDHDRQRVFFHTEIGKEYGGQGLGTRLIAEALDDVRAAGFRVVPICPFVKSYLDRHPQYGDLVDPVTPDLLARVGGA